MASGAHSERLRDLAQRIDAAGAARNPMVHGFVNPSPSPPPEDSATDINRNHSKRKRGESTLSGDDVCYRFAQTGQCRFAASCRFRHEAAGCVVRPERYIKYDISWDLDEEEDEEQNMRRGLAEMLARGHRLQNPVEPEPAHVLGTPIVFVPRSRRQSPSTYHHYDGETAGIAPNTACRVAMRAKLPAEDEELEQTDNDSEDAKSTAFGTKRRTHRPQQYRQKAVEAEP